MSILLVFGFIADISSPQKTLHYTNRTLQDLFEKKARKNMKEVEASVKKGEGGERTQGRESEKGKKTRKCLPSPSLLLSPSCWPPIRPPFPLTLSPKRSPVKAFYCGRRLRVKFWFSSLDSRPFLSHPLKLLQHSPERLGVQEDGRQLWSLEDVPGIPEVDNTAIFLKTSLHLLNYLSSASPSF